MSHHRWPLSIFWVKNTSWSLGASWQFCWRPYLPYILMPFLLKVMVYSVTLTLLGKVPVSRLYHLGGATPCTYGRYYGGVYIWVYEQHVFTCKSASCLSFFRKCTIHPVLQPFFQGRFGWYLCVLVPNRRLPGGKHLRRVCYFFARNMWSKLNVFGHVKLSKMQGPNVLHGKLEVGKWPNFLMNALVIFGVIVQLSRKLWFRIYRYHQVLLRAIALQIK